MQLSYFNIFTLYIVIAMWDVENVLISDIYFEKNIQRQYRKLSFAIFPAQNVLLLHPITERVTWTLDDVSIAHQWNLLFETATERKFTFSKLAEANELLSPVLTGYISITQRWFVKNVCIKVISDL